MVAQAQDYRNRLEQLVAQVQSMVEGARRSKDVIRLNCLLDRLAQMKASVNIADTSLQNLREAGARNDEGASLHEYTRITIVHQKAQVLMGEAQACAGEDLSYVGATRVDVDVANVPPGDYTTPPLAPVIVPSPPPVPTVADPGTSTAPTAPTPGQPPPGVGPPTTPPAVPTPPDQVTKFM
jgi:hypothetical protein